jgi:hypothetical protein
MARTGRTKDVDLVELVQHVLHSEDLCRRQLLRLIVGAVPAATSCGSGGSRGRRLAEVERHILVWVDGGFRILEGVSFKSSMFRGSTARDGSEVVLVKGMMDALSAELRGLREATPPLQPPPAVSTSCLSPFFSPFHGFVHKMEALFFNVRPAERVWAPKAAIAAWAESSRRSSLRPLPIAPGRAACSDSSTAIRATSGRRRLPRGCRSGLQERAPDAGQLQQPDAMRNA